MDHGTDAWKLAPSLELHSTDVLLRKTASDAFLRTGLSELLASRGVTDLIVCGLQSEFCVDSTVRRAMALGYPVVLVADGHTTVDNGVLSAGQIAAHHNWTLSNIESCPSTSSRTVTSAARAASRSFVAAAYRSISVAPTPSGFSNFSRVRAAASSVVRI